MRVIMLMFMFASLVLSCDKEGCLVFHNPTHGAKIVSADLIILKNEYPPTKVKATKGELINAYY